MASTVKQSSRKSDKTTTTKRRKTSLKTRNKMVESNMPLVKYVFGRMSLFIPNHLGAEDLASCGTIGLMKAATEYDPTNRARFSTYAVPRIRGAILDELRARDWVPRSVKRKIRLLNQANERLDRRLAGAVSETKLAKAMSVSRRQLHKIMALSTPVSFVSLENKLSDSDDHDSVALADSLENPKAKEPLAELAAKEEGESLGKSILELPDPDRMVVTLHYYKGMMLKDIARLLKLSKSRVSQIHKHALERLRHKLRVFEPAKAV